VGTSFALFTLFSACACFCLHIPPNQTSLNKNMPP
jgi:hypothetical protein